MYQPRDGNRDPDNIVRLTETKCRLRNWPVIGFDLFDLYGYCAWRTAQRSDGRTVRLPTEAEWEAALWHGLTEEEWAAYGQIANSPVAPVGSTLILSSERPVDMVGNVQHWCDTKFESDSPGTENPRSNPDSGNPMAVRGGSLGVLGRRHEYMTDTDKSLGFRLVLTPPL